MRTRFMLRNEAGDVQQVVDTQDRTREQDVMLLCGARRVLFAGKGRISYRDLTVTNGAVKLWVETVL